MLEQQSKETKQSNSRVSQQFNRSQSMKSIELQVNISIGKNKYLLQVPRCSNLHEQVQKFLKQHHINLKYQGPILSMVREQLAKKQQIKQQNIQMQQLKRIKTQMQSKRNLLTVQHKNQIHQKQQNYQKHNRKNQTFSSTTTIKQNKQNYLSQFNSNNNSNHQNSIQPTNQSNLLDKTGKQQPMTAQQTKCQNVYQRWKIKQKLKQTQKLKNHNNNNTTNKKQRKDKSTNKSFLKQQQKSNTKIHKKLQTHSPDYFYNKGIKFQQAKQNHVQQMYKQRYPFQLNRQNSLTPNKKNQLHQRLFKQHKIKITKNIKYAHQREKDREKQRQKQRDQQIYKPKTNIDKYKQRVIERDSKIDQALGYLLDKKMIENPYKIQVVPKSPFRKTNF